MRKLVESLRRLFNAGKIKKNKIQEMEDDGTITEEEKLYILNE